MECCKAQVYNTATQYCCLERLFEFRVVSKTLGKTREVACSKQWEPTYNITLLPTDSTLQSKIM